MKNQHREAQSELLFVIYFNFQKRARHHSLIIKLKPAAV